MSTEYGENESWITRVCGLISWGMELSLLGWEDQGGNRAGKGARSFELGL